MRKRRQGDRVLLQPLRIATHNVRGLLSHRGGTPDAKRLIALMKSWETAQLDIICLQETRVMADLIDTARKQLFIAATAIRGSEYLSFWGPASTGPNGSPAGGVAILVRSSLAEQLTATETVEARSDDGRLVQLPLEWGGHSFNLVCAYLPSGSAAGQRNFIQHQLAPLARNGKHNIICADFNFVMQPQLDCTNPDARSADSVTANQLASAYPGLVDVFRQLHPALRSYTYFYRTRNIAGASRLDRIMASAAISENITSCRVENGAPSDHRMVICRLAPSTSAAVQQQPGKGLRRCKLYFMDHGDLRQRFTDWIDENATTMPSNPTAIIDWWPLFKSAMVTTIYRLNKESIRRHHAATEQLTQANIAAAQAFAAVERAATRGQQVHDLAQNAVSARTAAAHAAVEASVSTERRTRHTWLRMGEQPNPVMTKLLRPPATSRRIHALKCGNGATTSDPVKLAQEMITFWSGISNTATTNSEARATVLQALRAAGRRCPPGVAPEMGSPVVTREEVAKALKAAPAGRAPGADGIPADLYKRFDNKFAPILASVFSAAAQQQRLPKGFLDGVICCLHKTGDPTVTANYRPITLLDTDYRTLARVLATRLSKAFSQTISPEQTAFLPLRRIADNIALLQLAPHILRGSNESGVVAFLDFHKAYDTVNREFMLECLEALGVGDGFLEWVRLLHDGTRSAALVNGHLSQFIEFTAGVRQGCPLAPLLYLAIAQALLAWLSSQGFGIDIHKLKASQYADDYSQFLRNLAEIPAFINAMEQFGKASGQRLNITKSETIIIGATDTTAGAEQPQSSLRMVESAKTLGVHFNNNKGPTPVQSLAPSLDKANACMNRIAGMSLSTFGRAAAVSGYALSKALYKLEFEGIPSDGSLEKIISNATALVDRGISPAAYSNNPHARLPGVSNAILSLPIKCGGFGMLPMLQHVRARHAVLGIRGVAGGGCTLLKFNPPWALNLKNAVRLHHPAAQPLALLTARKHPTTGKPKVMGKIIDTDCALIERVCLAITHLPEPTIIDASRLTAEPWVSEAPLWGNPILKCRQRNGNEVTLENGFSDVVQLGSINTVGDAVRALDSFARMKEKLRGMRTTDRAPPRIRSECTRIYKEDVIDTGLFGGQGIELMPRALRNGIDALRRLESLIGHLPEGWEEAARQAGNANAVERYADMIDHIIGCLGWKLSNIPIPLATVTVKQATYLQMNEAFDKLKVKHEEFIREAKDMGNTEAVATEDKNYISSTYKRLWKIKWEADQKEAYWRLAVGGFSGFSMHRGQGHNCPCGRVDACSDRVHHFSTCTVAKALRTHIQDSADIGDEDSLFEIIVERRNLWLLAPPHQTIEQAIWDVVCLAAISAMDYGRRLLFASRNEQGYVGNGATLARVKTQVIADFWARLQSYVSLGIKPRGWDKIPPGHPWIERREDGSMRLNKPAYITFEEDLDE
jgi:exonuclease III